MIDSLTAAQIVGLTAAVLICLLVMHVVLLKFEGPSKIKCRYCDTRIEPDINTCDVCGSDLSPGSV